MGWRWSHGLLGGGDSVGAIVYCGRVALWSGVALRFGPAYGGAQGLATVGSRGGGGRGTPPAPPQTKKTALSVYNVE